jgi:hypothetical protein
MSKYCLEELASTSPAVELTKPSPTDNTEGEDNAFYQTSSELLSIPIFTL